MMIYVPIVLTAYTIRYTPKEENIVQIIDFVMSHLQSQCQKWYSLL